MDIQLLQAEHHVNICTDIYKPLIEADGLTLGGPIYNGKSNKTPYRQFWREK